nr:copia protein [Tanacetum cinerariifolium]
MSMKTKLTKDEEGESVDNTKYREDPKTSHLEAVKCIFRYIKGTMHLGLWYLKGSDIETVVYADSDHAGDYVYQKSTSGICTFIRCCLISWFLKKQIALDISTIDVEYVSTGKTCQQALWMKKALVNYGICLDDLPIMYENKRGIDLSKNPVKHSRTKHIEIRHHFLCYNFQKENISIKKVSSEDNIADILTKPLKRESFNYLHLGSNDMVHDYNLDESKNKAQLHKDKALNPKPSVITPARLPNTASGIQPTPRNYNEQTRNWPLLMSSRVTKKDVHITVKPRNQNHFLKSKDLACPTCKKWIYTANHDACILKDLFEIAIRQRFSPNKSSAVYVKTTPPISGLTWKPTGRIFTYVGLRPNGDALRKCILNGPYVPTTVVVQAVAATDDSPAVLKHTTVEAPKNMSPENKAHFESKKEAIYLILTRIGDEIYSTVNACQTAQEM